MSVKALLLSPTIQSSEIQEIVVLQQQKERVTVDLLKTYERFLSLCFPSDNASTPLFTEDKLTMAKTYIAKCEVKQNISLDLGKKVSAFIEKDGNVEALAQALYRNPKEQKLFLQSLSDPRGHLYA